MEKKFLLRINILFLLLIVISMFCSCTGEVNIIDCNNNEQINFSVSVPSWKGNDSIVSNSAKTETRATPITDASLGTDKIFGIIADVVNGSNYTTEIDQEVVSYNTTNKIWETVANHYWPGANKTINFYAYYPASITNGTITHTAGTTPTFTYTVPADAATQADIMTATGTGILGTTYSSTSVSFKHILAAVKFNVGTSGMPSGTIKSISITGVKTSGTYTFDNGWALGSTSTDVISSPSITITGTPGASITSGTYTFLMIPQIFKDATITVTYSNGGVISKTISGTWTAGNIYTYNISKTISVANFGYTGNVQTYIVPLTGTYKIECWGAQGGNTYASGGQGGYTCGNLRLSKGIPLYIYVGPTTSGTSPVFNCGSPALTGGSAVYASPGGGATDVRLQNGDWNDFNSLKSRIIVAASGGGGVVYSNSPQITGGYAGGLQAGPTKYVYYLGGSCPVFDSKNGVTVQTSTNGPIKDLAEDGYSNNNGKLVNSTYSIFGNYNNPPVGCGSGYYGGINYGSSDTVYNGMGGTSFISGYIGCNAIKESSTVDNIEHTGLPNHYSGYIFTNSIMIAGNAQMPSPTDGTETGHSGNGYARITFVSAN